MKRPKTSAARPPSDPLTAPPHLGLLLRHHVELLFAHPGLGLGGVKVVLLGLVGLAEPGVPLLRLLADLLPERLQLGEALPDDLGRRAALPQHVLAALEDVVVARLVALDLLLQGLRGGGVERHVNKHVDGFFWLLFGGGGRRGGRRVPGSS